MNNLLIQIPSYDNLLWRTFRLVEVHTQWVPYDIQKLSLREQLNRCFPEISTMVRKIRAKNWSNGWRRNEENQERGPVLQLTDWKAPCIAAAGWGLIPRLFFVLVWFFFFFFFFGQTYLACRILSLWLGIKPTPSAVEAQSLNPWTTREVLHGCS